MFNCLVYVDCAINGTDYPEAAKNVAKMTVNNPITVSMVKFSTKLVRYVGMFFIVGLTTLFAFLVQSSDLNYGLPSLAAMESMATAGLMDSAVIGTTLATFMLSLF